MVANTWLIRSVKVSLKNYNLSYFDSVQYDHSSEVGNTMKSYINLHTHHLSQDDGVFLFNNRFGYDKNMFTGKYFSVGIHPWDVHVIQSKHIVELELLIQNTNCLAVGECGLDKVCKSDFRQQKHFFDLQLQMAVRYNKPVIIHCVKAYDELFGICKTYHSKIPLIIHGFNKTDELAIQLINKGFYLSVSSAFLYKTKLSGQLLDKLFLETDDKPQMPISEVYDLASRKFSLDKDSFQEKIYHNFTTLFKL